MRWYGFLILIIGVLLGAFLRQLFLSPEPPRLEFTPPPSAQPGAEASVDDKLARLEERLVRRMEERIKAADAGTVVGSKVPARPASPIDDVTLPWDERMRLSVARATRLYEEKVDAFNHEGVDPIWAADASKQVQSALEMVAKRESLHFTSQIECRSSRCIASLTWPDYQTAEKEYRHTDVPVGDCSRTLLFYPPRDRTEEYKANIVYTCLEGN